MRPSTGERADYAAGMNEGAAWRGNPSAAPENLREAVFEGWRRRFREPGGGKRTAIWQRTLRRGRQYAEGFMQGAGMRAAICPIPLRRKAAAVVRAGEDEAALFQTLSRLEALPLQEIVVVASSPTERLYAAARGFTNAVVVGLPDSLDPDIGRALGAKLTAADIILFADGERPAESEQLARFLWECDGKLDVVLNDLGSRMGTFRRRGGIERLQEFLNASLRREDLKTNSLSVLPFALSRQALDALGASALTVPVKAHAQAILKGLRIGTGGFVRAELPANPAGSGWRKTAGDHAEAWSEAIGVRGSRMHFADSTRKRSLLGEWGT
ncbi:hypothetical protein ACFQMJ_13785 [Cohnella cellulosilytica]|uniref:Uncharacterized protein n=1 Tax=Cohnella cellulosilytica TaxID=986710 RepID=A0ABW2F8R1_9BACL